MNKVWTLVALLGISLTLNALLWRSRQRQVKYVTASNGNSRPTLFSMHDIAAAQQRATGRGVKIGIIDHYFGFDAHRELYAGGKDFLADDRSFREVGEHGLWLTRTAREIAPDAQIYALNATTGNEEKKVEAMVQALRWAAANDLDIVTYSDRAFSARLRPKIDAAVQAATSRGVNCVFIHYTHPLNLLPFAMLSPRDERYDRAPDVNVYHYDYNLLWVDSYGRRSRGEKAPPPYLSLSSTSVVAAAVLALVREVKPGLAPADYKQLLIETSRAYVARAHRGPEVIQSCPRVLDALEAVQRAESLAKN